MTGMSFSIGPIVYMALSPQRVTLREVKSGRTFSKVPEVALSGPPKVKILAIGAEARAHASDPGVKVINPFAHPRTLISDFTLAEQFVKLALRRVVGTSIFRLAPVLITHPLGEPEGGFTQVEWRAMRELGFGAGARKVDMLEGREPSDQELLNWKFGAGR